MLARELWQQAELHHRMADMLEGHSARNRERAAWSQEDGDTLAAELSIEEARLNLERARELRARALREERWARKAVRGAQRLCDRT